ncbi:MAG: hypothetical protein ABUK01_19230, partial [Leptospirales bacterium]
MAPTAFLIPSTKAESFEPTQLKNPVDSFLPLLFSFSASLLALRFSWAASFSAFLKCWSASLLPLALSRE